MAQDKVPVTLSLGPKLKEHVLYTALANHTMGTGFKSVVQMTFICYGHRKKLITRLLNTSVHFLRNLVSLF